MLRRQSSVSTTDGTMVSPSMQSCPRSPTSERLAAGSMRWGEYKTVNSRWCWISIMMYMSKANHTPKALEKKLSCLGWDSKPQHRCSTELYTCYMILQQILKTEIVFPCNATQRVHKRWILQLHASETYLQGPVVSA